MKKIAIIFSVIFLTSTMVDAKDSKLPTIADRYIHYRTFANTHDLERLLFLLDDAIISFSDFDNKDIKCFEYLVPDTIWIKERPKKNPKEGKHYTLRRLYHSELASTSYTYNREESTERTPAIEFVGTQFRVNKIEKDTSSGYYLSSDKSYKIYLTNTTTDENLVWTCNDDYWKRNKCVVHIISLNNKLDLLGQTLYSARRDGYGSNKYSNITKHKCVSVDAQIDLIDRQPQFNVKFSTIDELNKEATFTLPLSSDKFPSSDIVWLDEKQAEIAKNLNRTYEIDYVVRLDTVFDIPLNFYWIFGLVKDNRAQAYQTLKPENYQFADGTLYEGNVILIGDKITVREKEYYKAAFEGKAFYVPCSEISLTPDEAYQQLDTLLNSSQEVRDGFFETAKVLSLKSHLRDIGEALDEVKGYASKGISIPLWEVYDESEYTEGTGMRISFHNPTKKTIKYINISFVGYNAVDDRVGSTVTKKCIGPIAPDETGSYEFEYAWFTDIVEYAKITSLSVQYKDGTTKTVAKPHSVEWSDKTYEILTSSPLLPQLKMEISVSED